MKSKVISWEITDSVTYTEIRVVVRGSTMIQAMAGLWRWAMDSHRSFEQYERERKAGR